MVHQKLEKNGYKTILFSWTLASQDNPEVCFQLFGEVKDSKAAYHIITEGDQIEVSFNLSSR